MLLLLLLYSHRGGEDHRAAVCKQHMMGHLHRAPEQTPRRMKEAVHNAQRVVKENDFQALQQFQKGENEFVPHPSPVL